MNRELEKCKTCPRWDHNKHKMRNKVYCMFSCDERIKHQGRIAAEYNASVERETRELVKAMAERKKNDRR